MFRSVACCVAILALVAAAGPAGAVEPGAVNRPVLRVAKVAKEDCETRIGKLASSDAEGEERLGEKNEVIGVCAAEYRNDKTIDRLVKECRKYEEQPVIKQQFLAECELAAFGYANALRALKAEYRK